MVFQIEFWNKWMWRMVCGCWNMLLLLLLPSRFSCVRLCATSETAANQALPSLGFSRQEQWSGLPFFSPMHESEKWKWRRSVMSDSSRPHGLQPTRLLRPRVLEWGATAFSEPSFKTLLKSCLFPETLSTVTEIISSPFWLCWLALLLLLSFVHLSFHTYCIVLYGVVSCVQL